MSITFQCPQCSRVLRVADQAAGKHARCQCGVVLRVPMASAATRSAEKPGRVAPTAANPAPENASPSNPARGSQTAIQAQCTGCGKPHVLSASLAGKTIRCDCGSHIQLPAAESGATAGTVWLDRLASEESSADTVQVLESPEPETAWEAMRLQRKKKLKDEEVLDDYLSDKSWKHTDNWTFRRLFLFEPSIQNLCLVLGMAALISAVAWFVYSLAMERWLVFPIILFLMGLGSSIYGLVKLRKSGKNLGKLMDGE